MLSVCFSSVGAGFCTSSPASSGWIQSRKPLFPRQAFRYSGRRHEGDFSSLLHPLQQYMTLGAASPMTFRCGQCLLEAPTHHQCVQADRHHFFQATANYQKILQYNESTFAYEVDEELLTRPFCGLLSAKGPAQNPAEFAAGRWYKDYQREFFWEPDGCRLRRYRIQASSMLSVAMHPCLCTPGLFCLEQQHVL